MSLKTDLEDAVAQARTDADLMREIVQGPAEGAGSTVTTDSRTVDTVARTVAEMTEAYIDLIYELGLQEPPPPVIQFSYIFSEGQPGFYDADPVGSATNQDGPVGAATQSNSVLKPTIDEAKINGLDAIKFSAVDNHRLNIQGARDILRGETWVELRLTPYLEAAPVAPQGQAILRFDSSASTQPHIVVTILPSLQIRTAIRLEPGVNTQNLDSTYPIVLGVGNVVRIRIDVFNKKVTYGINWHDLTEHRPLIAGVPGWNRATEGPDQFADAEAAADPSFGRAGGEVDWWTTRYDFWTGKPTLADSNTWWEEQQAEVDAPLPATTIDVRELATRNSVVEARAGAVFEITAGTASAGVNRIASVSVDGSPITSAAVDWATSHAATATALAANINAESETYEAVAQGAKVFVKAIAGKAFGNGLTLAVDVDGDVTVDDDSQALTLGGIAYASGTVIAGAANGDVNVRLLDYDDQTTEHVGLFTIATTTGDTGTARPWDGWFWAPRGSHIVEARLDDAPSYNATISANDGRLIGLRILDDGQSNMKLVIAKLGQGGVFPFTSFRAFEANRRQTNPGEGWHPLHGRLGGGGGVYPLTGETNFGTGTTLNEGAGGNGGIKMGVTAAALVDYPVGTTFIAIGSSGTATRLPPSASPPDGGVNWQKAHAAITATGGGGYNFDVIRIQDGEEEANQHLGAALYKANTIAMVEDRRDRAGWMVPCLIGIMGPTATAAADIDPSTGKTYAEGIRKAQLELVYGDLEECYIYDNPLDSERQPLTGGGLDPQHGTFVRYENAGERGIINALHATDPTNFPTGCQGPKPASVTGAAGSNDVYVIFDLDGGTGVTGRTAATGFTGVTLTINFDEVTITESDATGNVARFRYEGDPLAEGDEIGWENLASAAPDRTNIIMDNGDVPAVSHPTMAPLTHTVTA